LAKEEKSVVDPNVRLLVCMTHRILAGETQQGQNPVWMDVEVEVDVDVNENVNVNVDL